MKRGFACLMVVSEKYNSHFVYRKRRAKLKNKELMKAMERKQKKFLNDNYDSVIAAEREEGERANA